MARFTSLKNNYTPDRRVGEILVGTDGSEDVAGLEGGRRARRPGAQRDVFEGHEQGLALDVREAEIDDPGVGVVGVAVEDHVRQVGREFVDELLAQTIDVLRVVLHLLLRELACGTYEKGGKR